jgi:hypothetical protein
MTSLSCDVPSVRVIADAIPLLTLAGRFWAT